MSCSVRQCTYGDNCCMRARLTAALSQHFGYSTFRDGQLDVMLPMMHSRDVFARMATGAGKSLCMFLPPLAWSEQACAVVISPLNGLIEQQVSITEHHKFIFNNSTCVGKHVNLSWYSGHSCWWSCVSPGRSKWLLSHW